MHPDIILEKVLKQQLGTSKLDGEETKENVSHVDFRICIGTEGTLFEKELPNQHETQPTKQKWFQLK